MKIFPPLPLYQYLMPCNQAFFESTSGKYGLDAKNILGNGPFEMVNRYSWEHDEYINLTAANTYHGEKPQYYPLPLPFLSEIWI